MLGHYLSTQREVKAKKRELVTKHLIESFEALTTFSAVVVGNVPGSRKTADDFNNAITKIQLLGSAEQIELVSGITEMMSKQRHIDPTKLDSLLRDLRKDLRAELDLAEVDKPINVARVVLAEDSSKSPNKEIQADL